MGSFLNNPGFDKSAILHLPGCAIWTDDAGTIVLGFSVKDTGASMEVNQGLEAQLADETGETPLFYFTKGTQARIKLTMLQTSLARMGRVCPGLHYDAVTGAITIGDLPGKQLSGGTIRHRPFAYPGGERDLVLRNAVNIADLTFVHQGVNPMVLDCSFEGTVDESQDDENLLNGGIGG